jgi:antitoxin CptB
MASLLATDLVATPRGDSGDGPETNFTRRRFPQVAGSIANLRGEQLLTFAPTIAISIPPGTTSGLLALDGIDKMTGSTRSSGGLDERRKRILFRCWHRGTREMDLILGRFADAEIAGLTDDELTDLEHLIEVPDPDLYAAVSGHAELAPQYASRLFDRIKSFRSPDHDA